MQDTRERLESILRQRIAVLDGSWGVLIQKRVRGEEEYRGERFRDHPLDVAGDPDLLNLTRPEIVRDIHRSYFEAGADIATTNTFTATRIGQADYGLQDVAAEMSLEGARLAREVADEFGGLVAGSVGPLNVALSLSPRVDDPAYRSATFDEVAEAYAEQIRALREGGVDLLLIETVFDTLNAKAAIVAAQDAAPELPLWLSFTAVDKSGRNLSGQTVEAFWISVEHAQPLVVGVNCSLGAAEMRPFVEDLAEIAPTWVACYPNAGLPNALGEHDELPEDTSRFLGEFARDGLVNIVGGCCGTTPEHVRQIVAAVDGVAPRAVPERRRCDSLLRPRAAGAASGLQLHDDRRADEHHGLGPLPPPRRGRGLPGGGRRRAPTGPRRGQPARREHGRRPARRRAGDDDLPQPRRDRARGGADPDRDRQLALVGARGGPQVRPGQGCRQLAVAEGGGGGVPRAGAHGSPLRRGRRGDGVRREGAGRDGRAQGRDLRARVPAARRGRRLPAGGPDLRPERPRRRYRHRGASRLREGVPRGAAADQGKLPGSEDERRDLQPQLRLPRQRRRARGNAFGLPLPRDPRRPRHGHRQRGPARRLRGHRAGAARARRGRHLRPASRGDRAARRVRRPCARRGDPA